MDSRHCFEGEDLSLGCGRSGVMCVWSICFVSRRKGWIGLEGIEASLVLGIGGGGAL